MDKSAVYSLHYDPVADQWDVVLGSWAYVQTRVRAIASHSDYSSAYADCAQRERELSELSEREERDLGRRLRAAASRGML